MHWPCVSVDGPVLGLGDIHKIGIYNETLGAAAAGGGGSGRLIKVCVSHTYLYEVKKRDTTLQDKVDMVDILQAWTK